MKQYSTDIKELIGFRFTLLFVSLVIILVMFLYEKLLNCNDLFKTYQQFLKYLNDLLN